MTTRKSTRSGQTRAGNFHVRDPAGRDFTTPLIRDGDPKGALVPTVVARGGGRPGLAAARSRTALVGRVTWEDAYAYAKFAGPRWAPQRHDFLAPAALGRGGRLPGGPHRRAAYGDQLCRIWNRLRWCCWWIWSPKTSRRSCFCGYARPFRRHRVLVYTIAPCHWWPANVGPADQKPFLVANPRRWTIWPPVRRATCWVTPGAVIMVGERGHGTGRLVGGRSAG